MPFVIHIFQNELDFVYKSGGFFFFFLQAVLAREALNISVSVVFYTVH